jgi:K+-transporting ATPase ATPase C chain
MNAILRPAFVVVGLFTVLLGIAAPGAMTAVSLVAFPSQANGSLITRDGKVIGSALLGQNFTAARYFHPRPSATSEPDPDNAGKTRDKPYNGAASAASNLAPTSAALLERITTAVAEQGGEKVPADAVTTSGSGLDPHISPENAARQVARVAEARGLPAARVQALVAVHTEGRLLGLLGEPRVNVLLLNLALDAM